MKIFYINNIFKRYFSHFSELSTPLSYTQYGNESTKKTLFVLHGLFGSKRNWATISKALCKHYPDLQVIAIDLRNHGDSPRSDNMTCDLMADDVFKLVQLLNISYNLTILGHSLGGKVAMNMALNENFKNVIHSLIIADVSPGRKYSANNFSEIIHLLKSINMEKTSNVNNIYDFRKMAHEKLKPSMPNKSLRDFLLSSLRESNNMKNNNAYEFSYNLPVIEKNLENILGYCPVDTDINNTDNLKKYLGKSLFVGGSESNYITKEDVPFIEKYFPNNRIEFIKGAGHWLHADKPIEFMEIIGNFLFKK